MASLGLFAAQLMRACELATRLRLSVLDSDLLVSRLYPSFTRPQDDGLTLVIP